MQHGGLPSRDTPLSDGECGIYMGGLGRVAPWRASGSRVKGAPGKKGLVQGRGSLQLFGEDEGGGQTTQQAGEADVRGN